MHTVTLTDGRTGHSQTVILFAPSDSPEICSITLEPIDINTDTLLGVAIKTGPVSAYPELVAARLQCGHCFNAMALLVNFAKNRMQCPLCRKGSHNSQLDLQRHFKTEPWLKAVCDAVGVSQLPPAIFVDVPVHATFVLYGTVAVDAPLALDFPLHKRPSIAMRCLLETVQRRAPTQYRLPSTFARSIEQQIRDMDIAFLQVHMHHAADDGVVMGMAYMRATVYPFPADFEPLIEPSSDHVCFGNNNVKQFIYTPSESTLDNVLAY
jgi:hypothetical protein